MRVKWLQIDKLITTVIALLTGFIALTATGGGIAMLIGLEDSRFPLEWLHGTPFPNYTIPALILAIVVGGSALFACVNIVIGTSFRWLVAITAGIIMMGFIVVEYLILQQEPPGPTGIEYLYFGLGLIVTVLAGYRRLDKDTLAGSGSR